MKRKLVLIAIILALLAVFRIYNSNTLTKLYTPQKNYKVILSDTPSKRVRGLSGMAELPKNTVMLFKMDKPEYTGIWMKDMKFPIDIVFLDESYTVVSYVDNVSPESYPTVFYPEKLSLYVIEMDAGDRLKSGLDKGVKVYYK